MTNHGNHNAVAIWQAGVDAVAADRLVAINVYVLNDGGRRLLAIGDEGYDLDCLDRLLVVGAGKAAAAMATGLEQKLKVLVASSNSKKWVRIKGLLNVPAGTLLPLKYIELIEARPAGVNEPTPQGIAGSKRMMRLLSEADERTGCIVLLSGGGSALLPLPIEGIGLEEKLAVTKLLSSAGANIVQLNTVRKHLSAIKGGKMAAACNAKWLHTLVISDVLGDPLDLIASGPTVPDTSRPQDALEILERFDPERTLPESVYRTLSLQIEKDNADAEAESLGVIRWSDRLHITVIGNNAVAVDAAGIEAEKRGYNHAMMSSRSSEKSAEEVGELLARTAVSMLSTASGMPNCLITGGEPVVQLVPADQRGKGGRNQQLVLAALQSWMKQPLEIQEQLKSRVMLLSGGTDGEDGPTDAAGAFVNGQVWKRVEALNLNPSDYLRTNDAYPFFELAGGLLKTGPTGTNVCDIRVVTVD